MEKIKVSNDIIDHSVEGEESENNSKSSLGLSSKVFMLLNKYTIVWIVVLTGIVLYFLNGNFATFSNLTSVLRQSAFVGIGAIGMTFVIMGGGIDLSIPGIVSLTAVVTAMLVPSVGILTAVLAALLCGLAQGFLNGLVITKLNIPPFVATLGTGFVYLAIVFIITNQQVIPVTSMDVLNLGVGSLLGIPIPFIIFVLCTVFCIYLTKYTRYGRFIRAVGSKMEASVIAGVPVHRVIIFSFMVLGLMTSLTGVTLAGYLSAANGTMGTGYELQAIAAAVVGGTSLRGGNGTFIGTLAGSIFFAVISNALDLFGIGSYWQYIATGLIIIFAITLDGLKNKKSGTV
ncbi:ABC transporter permease [Heyndrickxia ginsengihumi]|uniref:ABC transporter permease n=1 Tax=Heyndrickxia ginsengihumi TaxID=363870 RepID=UPI003D2120E9